jgi:hypothetical protein
MSAFQMTAVEIGWPILVLAAVGCYSIRVRGGRDRVASVVIALAITYVAFLLFSILTRVEAPFERYAAEFVGRVVLATFPAAVMLAAFGAAWAWRQGLVLRVLSVLVLLAAASGGIRAWERWFQ